MLVVIVTSCFIQIGNQIEEKSTSNIKTSQKKIDLKSEDSNSSLSDDDSTSSEVSVTETMDNSKTMAGDGSRSRQKEVDHKSDEILNPQLWGKNCGEPVSMFENVLFSRTIVKKIPMLALIKCG